MLLLNISTSIGQLFPLANVKGRKAIVSQAGTNDVTSYATHCNGILFTDKTWHKHMSNDDYKHIPTQIRKLIGFAKAIVDISTLIRQIFPLANVKGQRQ